MARDQTHRVAAAFAKRLSDSKTPLLTTNYVLAEALTRIRYDNGQSRALAFETLVHEMISGGQLSMAWITASIHEEAMKLFRQYSDHEFSVVDCSSFVVARRKRVREVFGFDHDFATMGFSIVPHAG